MLRKMKHIGSLVVLGICVVAFSIYTYREGFTPYVISPPITSMTDARIVKASSDITNAKKKADLLRIGLDAAKFTKRNADTIYKTAGLSLETAKTELNTAKTQLQLSPNNVTYQKAVKNAQTKVDTKQIDTNSAYARANAAEKALNEAMGKLNAALINTNELIANFNYLVNNIGKTSSSGKAPPAGPGGGSGGQSFGAGSGGGTNTESIPDAAPNFPNYKFKGCWTTGHDTSFPVLTDMYLTDIKSMDECVKRASQMGLSNVGYDGKGKCIAGKQDYTKSTSTQCYNTYKLDKSWLVYSNK